MEELITTKQVQELLQVDRVTIYRMLKDGRLNGVKVGNQWRFHLEEIDALLKRGTARPPANNNHNTNGYSPTEVLPTHCIHVIQDVFAQILDIASVTTDIEGNPITEFSNSCDFCNLILESPSGRQACIQSWKKLVQSPESDPIFSECHAGFQYARGRIEVNDKLTAIQIGGQFLLEAPEEEALKARINKLAEKYAIDQGKLEAASKSLRVIDPENIPQISGWLERVANTFEIIAHERAELLGRLKQISQVSSFEI